MVQGMRLSSDITSHRRQQENGKFHTTGHPHRRKRGFSNKELIAQNSSAPAVNLSMPTWAGILQGFQEIWAECNLHFRQGGL